MSGVLPVALRGVQCRFGRLVVLRAIDLDLKGGEIVGLMGANGSGKTTLFRILVGLAAPDAGSRSYAGVDSPEVGEALRAKIGFCAHAPALYPALSARENLDLFADLRAAVGASSAGDPGAVLAELGLDADLDRPVGAYSRGMAQRVALARALVAQPELYVLDEPFTALDARGRQRLAERLRAERERGAAIVLSSHDVDAVAALVDRALWLEGGRVAREVSRSDDFRAQLQTFAPQRAAAGS